MKYAFLFGVKRTITAGQTQTIYTCMAHLAHTIEILGGGNDLTILRGDDVPGLADCKGCDAQWD
jgi:hypothetical protein